ncbi:MULTISPECIES: ATP-binding protein [unclassified Janthinobacterium]|uniref:sensor histidine kinase n=1 Tax=unclassified Janthinobacterium TaxID=2610881 RepID=UPI001A253B91|nr:ATP-binding protein [Janthinobacterium sp. CG_23.4]MDH6158221.1 signal transduction histidine kinase [Janthinobacterium sp. CG_23.4]
MRKYRYWKAVAWESCDTRTLLWFFMALLLAGLWSITVLQLQHAHDSAIADARRDARSMARVFDEHAMRTIEGADQAVTYLRSRYQTLGKRLDIVADLQQGLHRAPLYNLLTIVDEHGDTLLSSRPFKPTNLADREHIRVHMQRDNGELYISKPLLGRVSKKWSIQMTRRINHADASFKGVVVVSLDPYYFTRLYDEVDLGNNSSIALVGSDGVVRARRVGAVNSIGQDISDSKVFALMQGKTRGGFTERSPVDGTLRIYAYEKLANYPLYILIGLDRDTVFAHYVSRRNQALLMAAVTSALIVLSWAALVLLIDRLVDSRARAIAASEAKSRFLSNMSHELRTPLNGILGFSELLLEQLREPEQAACVQTIHDSGRQLLAMVEAAMELSALENDQVRLKLTAVPLHQLMALALAPHRQRAARKGLQLAVHVSPATPPSIDCDRVRLVRVLDIVLDNAIRYTPTGRVDVHVTLNGADLQIEVRDTGTGIAQAQQARIFDKFSQADDTPSRAHGGAGMGLAIAQQLVTLMRGSIGVESTPGQGASFRLRLPLGGTASATAQDIKLTTLSHA